MILRNVIFLLYTTSISLLCSQQSLENAGWFSCQFLHLLLFGQSSFDGFVCFFWPHFLHVRHPLLLSQWWLYLWHLKLFKGAGMYCSTFLSQCSIFTSLGILGWLKVKIYISVWISSPILLMFIFFLVHDLFLSSDVAKDNSLLLITSFEVLSLSCGYDLHFIVLNMFISRIFSTCFQLSTSKSKMLFLFDSPRGCFTWNLFFTKNEDNLIAGLFQRVNDNKSWEFCSLIRWIRLGKI